MKIRILDLYKINNEIINIFFYYLLHLFIIKI